MTDDGSFVRDFEAAVDAVHRTDAAHRERALNQLSQLRDSPNACELLLTLVLTSRSGAAQAFASTLLRHAVLRDWSVLDAHAVEHIRDALLTRALDTSQTGVLDRAVRRQLLASACMLVKRTWPTHADLVASLLERARTLFASNVFPAPRVALDLCATLVEQFSYRSNNNNITGGGGVAASSAGGNENAAVAGSNLSLEFHLAACREFEQRHLLDVFFLILEQSRAAFDEFYAFLRDDSGDAPPQLVALLEDAFDLLRAVLEWPFVDEFVDRRSSMLVTPVWLPASWIPSLLPSLEPCANFLLSVLERVGRDSRISQRVRTVLERFVSIDGAFASAGDDGAALIRVLLPLVTRLLRSSLDSGAHLQSYFVMGAVEVAHSFVFVHESARLVSAGDEAVAAFVQQLAFTAVASLQPEAPGGDSALQGETQELALTALAEVINESVVVPAAYAVLGGDDVSTVAAPPASRSTDMSPLSPALRATFGECAERVTVAFGEARMREAANVESWDDGNEFDSDVDLFDEQLRAVGRLARVALALNAEATQFWPQISAALVMLSNGDGGEHASVASERAHWLLMIATHMLCVVDQRVVPASLNWASSVATSDAADHVSTLSDALVAFLRAKHERLAPTDSPLLVQTELWALTCWLSTYAFPSSGRGFAPRLAAKFDGDAGSGALTFVVEKVTRILSVFAGEPEVCEAAADALGALARLRRARALASGNEAFLRFAESLVSSLFVSKGRLGGKAVRKLFAAVVRLASDVPNSVTIIGAPLAAQLHAIVAEASVASQFQSAAVKDGVCLSVECLRGLCCGVTDGNRVETAIFFLEPGPASQSGGLLTLFEPLLDVYALHEEMIVSLLKGLRQVTTLVSHMFESELLMIALSEVCCAALRRFSHSSMQSTIVRRVDEGSFGDRCSDIVAILDIVSNFAPRVAQSTPALAVVVAGLAVVLPLVSDNVAVGVLQIGKVARRVYGVLYAVFESNAAVVLPQLAPPVHAMLFGALQHGFSQNNAEALSFAIDTLAGLASAVDEAALAELLGTLLSGMIGNDVTLALSVISSASDALRAASPTVLQQSCERALAISVGRAPREQAASVEARLSHALQELLSDVPLAQTSFFTHAGHGVDAQTALLFRVRLRLFLLHARTFANFA
jgi:hypothetical protein